MNKLIALALLFLFSYTQLEAQEFTLDQIVEYAKSRSISFKQAQTRRKNGYWQFRVYKSNYIPQLTLNGILPNYQRQFNPVTQPDGTIVFRPVEQSLSNVNLGISQSVGLTGAEVYLGSGLERYDDYSSDLGQWRSDIFQLGLVQPIFSFNELKWDRRIEPLRYEEVKRGYVEDLEDISLQATRIFFDLLLAQKSLEIASLNLSNSDTIYQIGQGRYNLGTIAENQLLQLELTKLNAEQAVSQAELDIETNLLRLKSFLGITQYDDIELVIPEIIPDFDIQVGRALEEANKNRSEVIAFRRRQLEARQELARARGETGLNMDLTASFGVTNSGIELQDTYADPRNQLAVQLGFQIPILDWGRTKSRLETARAFQELTNYTVEQEKMNFEQEVFTLVKQLEMLRNKVRISRKADEVAQNRFDISKNRYLIGKISITDLNIALQEKDQAKREYVQSLRDFWTTYYQVRRITLYDFENDLPLYVPQEEDGQEF